MSYEIQSPSLKKVVFFPDIPNKSKTIQKLVGRNIYTRQSYIGSQEDLGPLTALYLSLKKMKERSPETNAKLLHDVTWYYQQRRPGEDPDYGGEQEGSRIPYPSEEAERQIRRSVPKTTTSIGYVRLARLLLQAPAMKTGEFWNGSTEDQLRPLVNKVPLKYMEDAMEVLGHKKIVNRTTGDKKAKYAVYWPIVRDTYMNLCKTPAANRVRCSTTSWQAPFTTKAGMSAASRARNAKSSGRSGRNLVSPSPSRKGGPRPRSRSHALRLGERPRGANRTA